MLFIVKDNQAKGKKREKLRLKLDYLKTRNLLKPEFLIKVQHNIMSFSTK